MSNLKVMNVIELFSGIGGFHLALKSYLKSSKLFKNTQLNLYPFDNNCNANKVYQKNFNIIVNNKNIEHLNHNDLDKLKAFIITMSPPCQPYSRAGIKKDLKDNRSCALHHFCDKILPKMKFLPNYLMLENVIGFESSLSCKHFIKSIIKCGYQYKIYSIDPPQIGIPNTRKRIYILAKKVNTNLNKKNQIDTETSIDIDIITKLAMNDYHNYHINKLKIGDFIMKNNDDNNDKYMIDMNKIDKYKGYKFNVVTMNDENSECFTKSYGIKKKFIKGSGSLFASKLIDKDDMIKFKNKYQKLCKIKNDKNHQEIMQLLSNIGLRFFTPREMSLLMGFPSDFLFPNDMNDSQFYKLIGNSVNCHVVTILLSILFET